MAHNPQPSMDGAVQTDTANVASMAHVSDTVKAHCEVTVLELFPDIDPAHMTLLCEERRWESGDVIQHILDNQEQSKHYPKSIRVNLKRKREDDVDAITPASAAKKWDNEGRRSQVRDPKSLYIKTSHNILQQFFPHLYVDNLKAVMALNNSLLYPTFLALSKAPAAADANNPHLKRKKGRIAKTPPPLANNLDLSIQQARSDDEREALEELRDARIVVAIQETEASEKRREEQEQEENFENARAEGAIEDCGCCFGEFAINRMVHCDGEAIHLFCRDCARLNAETQIGMAKHKLDCMSTDGCTGGFAHSQRLVFLDAKSRMALEQIEMDASIRACGIENIETCPFCSYAAEYPDIEVNREFRCLRDDCGVVSCRACRKETHIPKTCEEAALDLGHSARHGIEEAMSEALIRKCNKCSTAFIKEHGCNKMTCTKCSNVQCYICSKSCDYSHFNDPRRGGRTGNCDLFDKDGGVEARHQQEVKVAEEEARKKVQEQHRDLNPDFLQFKESEKVREDEASRKQKLGHGGHGFPHVYMRQHMPLYLANGRPMPHAVHHPAPQQDVDAVPHPQPNPPPNPQPSPHPGDRIKAKVDAFKRHNEAKIQAYSPLQGAAAAARRYEHAYYRNRWTPAAEAAAIDPAQLWQGPQHQGQHQLALPQHYRQLPPPLYPLAPAPELHPQPFALDYGMPFEFDQDLRNAQFDVFFGGLYGAADQGPQGAGAAAAEARQVSLLHGPLDNPVRIGPLPSPQLPGRVSLAVPRRGDRAQLAQPDPHGANNLSANLTVVSPPRPQRARGGRDDPIELSPAGSFAGSMIDLTDEQENENADGAIKVRGIGPGDGLFDNLYAHGYNGW